MLKKKFPTRTFRWSARAPRRAVLPKRRYEALTAVDRIVEPPSGRRRRARIVDDLGEASRSLRFLLFARIGSGQDEDAFGVESGVCNRLAQLALIATWATGAAGA